MHPKEKSEWVGLKVLFYLKEPVIVMFGCFQRIYKSRLRCGVIADVTDSGYVQIKERDYYDGEWFPLADFQLVEVLSDKPGEAEYKDSYSRQP